MNDWLTRLSDFQLLVYKLDVEQMVNKWDGHDDDLYRVWKTLLELIWGEQKRRKQ